MSHLQPLVNGEIVRIKSGGIVAVGPVMSWYGEFVLDQDGRIIGEEVAGIEMWDILPGRERVEYRYWKSIDRKPHEVEKWIPEWPGRWEQIYPHTLEGMTSEQRRIKSEGV